MVVLMKMFLILGKVLQYLYLSKQIKTANQYMHFDSMVRENKI